jgi:flagellar basal body rod protein FlgC
VPTPFDIISPHIAEALILRINFDVGAQNLANYISYHVEKSTPYLFFEIVFYRINKKSSILEIAIPAQKIDLDNKICFG